MTNSIAQHGETVADMQWRKEPAPIAAWFGVALIKRGNVPFMKMWRTWQLFSPIVIAVAAPSPILCSFALQFMTWHTITITCTTAVQRQCVFCMRCRL